MKPAARMLVALSAAALALGGAGQARAASHGGTTAKVAEAKQSAVHKATGVVKKIDPDRGAVTLAHDAIPSLKWPAMTMSFKVADKGLLRQLSPERKVMFDFTQQGRDYVITSIR
jgi:Cu(I)/Ag(I) efflux system periplasmic protein CusF